MYSKVSICTILAFQSVELNALDLRAMAMQTRSSAKDQCKATTIKLGLMSGACTKTTRERQPRPARGKAQLTNCLFGSKPGECQDKDPKPTPSEKEMFKAGDFGWEVSKWIHHFTDLLPIDENGIVRDENTYVFSSKVESEITKSYLREYASSKTADIAETFDMIGPALQVAYLQADNVSSASAPIIHTVKEDYGDFIFKSKGAIRDIMYGSYLVFMKHQSAIQKLSYIDDYQLTTGENLEVFQMAYEDLLAAKPYVDEMIVECNSQTSQLETLMDETKKAIDLVVKERSDAGIHNKGLKGVMAELSSNISATQQEIESYRDQLADQQKELDETYKLKEAEKEKRTEAWKDAQIQISSLKAHPVCPEKPAKRSGNVFQKIGKFFAGGVDEPAQPPCVYKVDQAQLNALVNIQETQDKALKEAVDDLREKWTRLEETKVEIMKKEQTKALLEIELNRQLSTTTLESADIEIAIATLKNVQVKLLEVRIAFKKLSDYFDSWLARFKVLQEKLKYQTEEVGKFAGITEEGKEVKPRYQLSKTVHMLHWSDVHEQIYKSTLEWVVQVRLAHNATQQIEQTQTEFNGQSISQDLPGMLQIYNSKAQLFLEKNSGEIDSAMKELETIKTDVKEEVGAESDDADKEAADEVPAAA